MVDNNFNADVSPFSRGFLTALGVGIATPAEQLHVYKPGAASNVKIETDSTNQAGIILKNGSREWRMFGSAGGVFLVDTTAGANRWQWDTNGNQLPAAHVAYDLGNSGAAIRRIFTGQINLVDGITAPSTIAGCGAIYIDSVDGDLKVKFGDGTVKTISVDT